MYEEIITDDIFLQLQKEQKQKGIFDIVGQTHTEQWHSSFICWLLSPDANHGLTDFPLNRLLYLYLRKLNEVQNNECEKIDEADIFNEGYKNFTFKTESQISSGRIDIFGKCKKGFIDKSSQPQDFIIVIENKIDSNENKTNNKNQTENYYEYFSNNPKYKNAKIIYIFLAPTNTEPANKHFMKISYQELYDSVISNCLAHPETNEEARYLIKQYVCNLRKKSNKTKQALALPSISECKSLYNKYQDSFNKMFNVLKEKDTDTTSIEYKLYQKYQSVFNEIFLSEKGMIPSLDLKGKELLSFLVNSGTITKDAEFYSEDKTYNIKYEADLKEVDGGYRLIIGYHKDGKIYPVYENGDFKEYTSFSSAAKAVRKAFYDDNNITYSSISINGNDFWHYGNTDGSTPNQLLNGSC